MSAPPADVRRSHEGIRRVLFDGAYADLWLRAQRRRRPGGDLPLVERRVLGTLERHHQLSALLNAYLAKPLDKLPPDGQVALRLGGFRLLWEDRSPAYAVVDAAVASAGRARWLRGIINAVLRRVADGGRQRLDALVAAGGPALAAGLPDWWADELAPAAAAAGFAGGEVLAGLRAEPGLHVVDWTAAAGSAGGRKPERDGRRRLADAGVQADATPLRGVFRITENPNAFWELSEADRVSFAIQDLSVAAFLDVALADAEPPLWDAFAAPGGKLLGAAHRLGAHGLVIGTDRSEKRLGLVRAEAARRGVTCPPLVAAAAEQPPWRPGTRFRTVIADAPCTASGTLPRHPEVAIRLEPEDVERLAAAQGEWLAALAPWVASGGTLWYATCSLFPAENERVGEAFLAAHPAWKRRPLRHPLTGEQAEVLRFWPGRDRCQGFCAQALVAPEIGPGG